MRGRVRPRLRDPNSRRVFLGRSAGWSSPSRIKSEKGCCRLVARTKPLGRINPLVFPNRPGTARRRRALRRGGAVSPPHRSADRGRADLEPVWAAVDRVGPAKLGEGPADPDDLRAVGEGFLGGDQARPRVRLIRRLARVGQDRRRQADDLGLARLAQRLLQRRDSPAFRALDPINEVAALGRLGVAAGNRQIAQSKAVGAVA